MEYTNADLLVSPQWLEEHKGDPDLVIIDCPMDEGSYNRAHIPGAIKRSGHPYIKGKDPNGNITRHLPGPDECKALMAEMGIGSHSSVILYDDLGSILSTRLWWVLKYYGFEHATILNGGWQGWVSAGLPVSYKVYKPSGKVGPFVPSLHSERLITIEQVKENYNDPRWTVVDVRSEAEYFGKDARGNKRGGHIPGAIHLEWNNLLENSKDAEAVRSFKSADEIKDLMYNKGIENDQKIVTHCQSGVRASLVAFALELIGYPVPRVYDASMAEWANLADSPLE